MRLIAEERKTKTISLLMTLPLGNAEIILGKFLAAEALLGVGLLLTLPYALTVASVGMLDWGPVWGGYFGALLMGAAYLAVGMFCTSLTSNQIVAFILGLGICFVFFILDKVLIFLPERLSTRVRVPFGGLPFSQHRPGRDRPARHGFLPVIHCRVHHLFDLCDPARRLAIAEGGRA